MCGGACLAAGYQRLRCGLLVRNPQQVLAAEQDNVCSAYRLVPFSPDKYPAHGRAQPLGSDADLAGSGQDDSSMLVSSQAGGRCGAAGFLSTCCPLAGYTEMVCGLPLRTEELTSGASNVLSDGSHVAAASTATGGPQVLCMPGADCWQSCWLCCLESWLCC